MSLAKEEQATEVLRSFLEEHGSVTYKLKRKREVLTWWPFTLSLVAGTLCTLVYAWCGYLLAGVASQYDGDLLGKFVVGGAVLFICTGATTRGAIEAYASKFAYKQVPETYMDTIRLGNDYTFNRTLGKNFKTFEDLFKIDGFELDNLIEAMDKIETDKALAKNRAETRHDKFLARFQKVG